VKTAIGLLTLALAAAPAAAEPRLLILAPPEYDHPYKGTLTWQMAHDQQQVRDACPKVAFKLGVALACSLRWEKENACLIVLAPEEDMKKAGLPLEMIKRHEIAHCNGWPADHKGALPFEDWAVPPPVLNAASQFDKFALGAVRKTVADVALSLDHGSDIFILAAKAIGLDPESRVTPEVLGDPTTARPLAEGAGIGTDLSDEEWRRAHAIAWQASKTRQAENATIAGASQSAPNPGKAAPQPQQAHPTAARATTDFVCAVVLNTPDGFLAVRERPGTQFRMMYKLRPGQAVNISSEDCVWHSNGKVTCNKWIMLSGSDRTPASGWVRSKYLQPYPDC
jgi:hypothetical protein